MTDGVAAIQAAVAGLGDMGARIDLVSKSFVGRPYLADSLTGSETREEEFTCALDGFDCVTYCETVLALALSRTEEGFHAILRRIRYDGGRVSWATRNHYMSDWLARNAAEGFLDILPPPQAREIALEKSLSIIKALPAQASRLSMFRAEDTGLARTGDIVAFGSTRDDLDVFHCGFVIAAANGEPLLRHCGKKMKGVGEEPLQGFIARNEVSGLLFARPLPGGK